MTFQAKYYAECTRRNLIKKIEKKRRLWLAIVNNQQLPEAIRIKFFKKLRSTRNYSTVRVKNRCLVSNRAGSVIRFFRLSRIVFRLYAREGLLSGVRKSSW